MPTRPRPLRRSRRGFSLVELIVALTVLAIGLLGVASVSTLVARRIAIAESHVLSTTAAGSLIDSLAGIPCPSVASGSDAAGRVAREWTVSGTGRARAIRVDTRAVSAPGRERVERLTTAIPCGAP